MKQLFVNGIMMELEKKRIKNMYIRILPPEGRVRISAPIRMSEEEIERFVITKLDWIEIQQKNVQNRNTHRELEFVSGEEVYVWGKNLSLLVKDDSTRNSVQITGEHMLLSLRKDSTVLQRKKVVNDWYRDLLQQELPHIILKWERIIGVTSSGFSIRDMKTRWGTCNVRTKKICLNLQLAKKSPICLEYVVVHELVHLLEKSHNSIFKGYMDMFLPQWRTIKKQLNGKD